MAEEPLKGTPPGFDGHYGLHLDSVTDEEVLAHVEVRDHHKQPTGVVHGGVYASMGEAMASIGTWFGVRENDQIALGLSNQTSFLRPVVGGTIHAVARRRHRGRSTWLWEVDISDDQQRLCALVRMTVAVRPLPQPE